MATNIPPHNLGEVIDACVALIDNPALSIDELIDIIRDRIPDRRHHPRAPGHPLGLSPRPRLDRDARQVRIDTIRKDREAIIHSEIPYQVNKARWSRASASCTARRRSMESPTCATNRSRRYRVVVELKRDAMADVVLNQLYRFTPLQTNFGANIVALDGGRPQ